MPPQISKETFAEALMEMGHDPQTYRGKKLSLVGMSDLYGIEADLILDAIDSRHLSAHYDYNNDTIWIDALDAAHFFYCVKAEGPMYAE